VAGRLNTFFSRKNGGLQRGGGRARKGVRETCSNVYVKWEVGAVNLRDDPTRKVLGGGGEAGYSEGGNSQRMG